MEEVMSRGASLGFVTPGADGGAQQEDPGSSAGSDPPDAGAGGGRGASVGGAEGAAEGRIVDGMARGGNPEAPPVAELVAAMPDEPAADTTRVMAQLLEVMPKVLRAPGGAPISRLVEDGELLERYVEMTRSLPPQAQHALFVFVQGAYRQSYQHMHTQAETFFEAYSAIRGLLDSDDLRLLRQLKLDLVRVKRVFRNIDRDTLNLRRCIERNDYNSIAPFLDGLIRGIDGFTNAYGDLRSLMKRVKDSLSSIKLRLEEGEEKALQCRQRAEQEHERRRRMFSSLDGLNSFIRSVTIAGSLSLVAMTAVPSALAGCHIAFALQLGGAAAFYTMLMPFMPVVGAIAFSAAITAATAVNPATACAVAQAAASSPAGAAALAVSPLCWVVGSSVLLVLIFIGSASRKILSDVLERIWGRDIERCGSVQRFYRDMRAEVDGMEKKLGDSLPGFQSLDKAFDTIRDELEVLKYDAEEMGKRVQVPAEDAPLALEEEDDRRGELFESVENLAMSFEDLNRQLGGAAHSLRGVFESSFLRAGEIQDEDGNGALSLPAIAPVAAAEGFN